MNLVGKARAESLEVKADASITGTLVIDNHVSAEEFKLVGDCTCKGIRAGKFNVRGNFQASEYVNADDVNIKSQWNSTTKEMGGKKIVVRRSRLGIHCILEADAMEYDTVDIQHTKAKVVRGRDVIIGKGCEVELVEYSGTYEAQSGAKVGKAVKV